ncbi:MAG TPA: response regulator transcription factor [Tepidisphaeraceae bacterium]|jgi:DNA-binding response OmpR family regulator
MPGEHILIIEDDPALLRGLSDNFTYEGFHISTASDGEEGLCKARHGKPDLIVLDIMLPRVNGYEICRLLRAEHIAAPIIMLTAKSQEPDVILGLNLGADDYVTKPFSIRQLLARVNALLRRTRRQQEQVHLFGPYELNLSSRRLLKDGHEIALTPKEFALLELFVKSADRALTRDHILDRVWGHDVFVTGRSVDRCINTLRNKIEPDPRQPTFIKTIRDIGYRFESET